MEVSAKKHPRMTWLAMKYEFSKKIGNSDWNKYQILPSNLQFGESFISNFITQ